MQRLALAGDHPSGRRQWNAMRWVDEEEQKLFITVPEAGQDVWHQHDVW